MTHRGLFQPLPFCEALIFKELQELLPPARSDHLSGPHVHALVRVPGASAALLSFKGTFQLNYK